MAVTTTAVIQEENDGREAVRSLSSEANEFGDCRLLRLNKNLSFQDLKTSPWKAAAELSRTKFFDINDTKAPGAVPKEKIMC